jgi:hypothetical protein
MSYTRTGDGIKALVLQAEKDSLPVTDEEISADIDNQIRYFTSPVHTGQKKNWKRFPVKLFTS